MAAPPEDMGSRSFVLGEGGAGSCGVGFRVEGLGLEG